MDAETALKEIRAMENARRDYLKAVAKAKEVRELRSQMEDLRYNLAYAEDQLKYLWECATPYVTRLESTDAH